MPVQIGLYSQIPCKFFSSGTAASLGPAASLVFLALCENANRHGKNMFKASDKALASETGYSPRKICDARKRLIEKKLISCSRHDGESYDYTLFSYSFDWVRLEDRLRKKRKPRALYSSRAAKP
jgi:hypothetical protein